MRVFCSVERSPTPNRRRVMLRREARHHLRQNAGMAEVRGEAARAAAVANVAPAWAADAARAWEWAGWVPAECPMALAVVPEAAAPAEADR